MSVRISPPLRLLPKDLSVSLASALSGLWIAVTGVRYWHSHDLYFFNYREAAEFYTWPLLWLGVGAALYALGIYVAAFVFRTSLSTSCIFL